MRSSGQVSSRTLGFVLGGIAAVILLGFLLWHLWSGPRPAQPGVELGLAPLGAQKATPVQPTPRPSRVVWVGPEETPAAVEQPSATPTVPVIESNADRLARITSNWIYRGFVGVGAEGRGKFNRRMPTNEVFFTTVGEMVEGVTLTRLDRLAATARLGDATILLALVPEPRIEPEQMINPGIPTEEEVRQAKTAYWENYGKYFNEMGKRYTPKPGERMPPPQPQSPEEAATAQANYMATFAPNFQKMNAQRTPVPGEIMPRPHQDPLEEQQAIDAYYRKYRPWATPPPPKNQ